MIFAGRLATRTTQRSPTHELPGAGRRAEISVAGAVGTTPIVLEIARIKDGWPATVELISAEISGRTFERARARLGRTMMTIM